MKTTYPGQELELFSLAGNWKDYWSGRIFPFIRGNVLEVGAGIGATTQALFQAQFESWLCLEPDPGLSVVLAGKITDKITAGTHQVICGTLEDIPKERAFNTVLYIDVLEHISDDRQELLRARDLLADSGYLIILAPAHQWLFSEFDHAIGHYRRYNRGRLKAVIPAGFELLSLGYLDSVGLAASLANRLFLHTATPGHKQILFWDKVIIPCSRVLDYVLLHLLGKTILGIWKKHG